MKLAIRLMLCLMISFTLVELPAMKAHAGMIGTMEVAQRIDRELATKNLVNFLERSDVKDQLVKLGVKPEEAGRRIASLSDAELEKLNKDIENGTVGGDVTGILVIVLLVLAIIYLAKRV